MAVGPRRARARADVAAVVRLRLHFQPAAPKRACGASRMLPCQECRRRQDIENKNDEDTVGDTTRTLFRFDFNHAPIQIGILPLSKKDDLINISNELKNMLQEKYRIEIDITQSIGKRYRRQDEIGTPYCITVDFDTLDDKSVTIRNRDTMEQERISIENLLDYFSGI